MQKNKHIVAVFLSIVFVFCASFSVKADSNLQNLAKCRRIYAYNGDNNAYFFGYSNHMLCSARVIPDGIERTVTTDGVIRAVCHDETITYALMTTANSQYSLIRLDMNSGDYVISSLASGNTINHDSFSASDGEIFLIVQDSTYGHVESCDYAGNRLYSYYLDKGVNYLFNNGGKSYAVSYSGEIFSLSYGKQIFCAEIEAYSECRNAGVGYIRTENGQLVSLCGKVNRFSYDAQAVISDEELFSADHGILFAAANHFQACLENNYQCIVNHFDTEEETIANSGLADNAEDTVVVDVGLTVAALKKKDEAISAVFDNDGNEITAGKLRTGYSLRKNGIEHPLAVCGDLNASGTVNSRDIKLFMNYLVGNETLTGVFSVAADINRDGQLDNRDLVFLSKLVKKQ